MSVDDNGAFPGYSTVESRNGPGGNKSEINGIHGELLGRWAMMKNKAGY